MLRYQCTTHLCQAASGKNSAALSARPMQASEVMPDTLQPAFLAMLEDRAPATLVLLRPLANAENLPIAALVHADCNQERDVAYLAGPAALEHDAIEINIWVLALDRTIAPRLHRPVDLLVQVRHIVIRCPQRGRPVPTGLTTDMVVLETLPNVCVPLVCRACGQIHRWTPNDAWAADIPKLAHSA